MRPSFLKQSILALIADAQERNTHARALLVEGAPGGGKTSVVKQIAEELNWHFVIKHMPTMLVEDFGVPKLGEETFTYNLPEWFPAVGSKWDDGRPGILCFDDRTQAGADLQKVLANIIQERELHGRHLIPGWFICSTGNRQEDRAGANRTLSHLADRETTVQYETHKDDSFNWMIENNISPIVIAFLQFKPDLLHAFDPTRSKNSTPRGWCEGVSPKVGVLPAAAEQAFFAGDVGEGAAVEFTAFLRTYRDLPDVQWSIANPQKADVPSRKDVLYAFCGAIAAHATDKNFENISTLIGRFPKEFDVLTMQMICKKHPPLRSTKTFVNWAIRNSEVLF